MAGLRNQKICDNLRRQFKINEYIELIHMLLYKCESFVPEKIEKFLGFNIGKSVLVLH